MADYSEVQLANVELPLDELSTSTLLRDADPTVYWALAFYKKVIERLLGDRLLAACQSAGVGAITRAVAYTTAMDPAPYLQSQQYRFPLLAVYRKEQSFRERTSVFPQAVSEFEVAYILPPLTGGQAEAVSPILHAASTALFLATEHGFDEDFEDGARVWGENYANVEEAGFVRGEYGGFPALRELTFPAWIGTLRIKEREMPVTSQFELFDGLDAAIDVETGGTTVGDFVELETQSAPTIDSISASVGSSAGGTSVTLTGSRYRDGAEVWFGAYQATSVVVVSATSITCVTPAHAAYPSTTVDVLVVNPDGQEGLLEDGFTFATNQDPAGLSLKMLLVPGSYSDTPPATWTGSASLGTSGAYNVLDDGGTPPVDALCAGLTVAKFTGAVYLGSVPKVLSQIVSAGAGTLAVVIRPTAAPATAATAKTAAIVFNDVVSNPSLVISYDASGIRVGARDAGGWKELTAFASATNVDALVIVTWNGTTLKASVNGGAWSSTSCGALADVTQPYVYGTDYNGAYFFTGSVKHSFACATEFTDEQRDGVTAYLQTLPWWGVAVA